MFSDERITTTQPLWDESCVYTSDVINMTATVKDNPEMHTPYHKFDGRAPFARLLAFLKPGFHHDSRVLKTEQKEEACFCLMRQPPLSSLQQESAGVWLKVVLPPRYLGAPEETACGLLPSEEESSPPPPSSPSPSPPGTPEPLPGPDV